MIFKIDKNSRNSIEVGKGIKRIHVNQHIIKSNAKRNEREPVLVSLYTNLISLCPVVLKSG